MRTLREAAEATATMRRRPGRLIRGTGRAPTPARAIRGRLGRPSAAASRGRSGLRARRRKPTSRPRRGSLTATARLAEAAAATAAIGTKMPNGSEVGASTNGFEVVCDTPDA